MYTQRLHKVYSTNKNAQWTWTVAMHMHMYWNILRFSLLCLTLLCFALDAEWTENQKWKKKKYFFFHRIPEHMAFAKKWKYCKKKFPWNEWANEWKKIKKKNAQRNKHRDCGCFTFLNRINVIGNRRKSKIKKNW